MANRIEFISFDEFKQLHTKCKCKELKLAMLLGFGSGLRISEIIGFKRKFKHITNKETKELKLIKDDSFIPPLTADKVDLEKHQIRIDEAKGGKWRITIVSPALKPEHLNLLPLKYKNKPYKRRTLQYQFERLALKVLGKKMSFHILRHGFGNYQVNVLKVPLPIVQSMMGHADISTTGIYTKVNPEEAINFSWKAMGGK